MKRQTQGLSIELTHSKTYHGDGIPLLVSPLLLRKRNLGQIDLARVLKDRSGSWLIEIGEVKSSEIGAEMMERSQRKRLFSAQTFLSGLLGHRSKLIRLIG